MMINHVNMEIQENQFASEHRHIYIATATTTVTFKARSC